VWILFLVFSFRPFNKLSNNVIDYRNCYQEKNCEHHEALESMSDRKRYAPEHISNDQKDHRPNERGNELDANKMSEGNFKNTQYDKGRMVQPVNELRQENNVKRVSSDTRKISLDALHHE